ncbi:hypothetical protein FKM82_021372 [Ascaphus truei]
MNMMYILCQNSSRARKMRLQLVKLSNCDSKSRRSEVGVVDASVGSLTSLSPWPLLTLLDVAFTSLSRNKGQFAHYEKRSLVI